MLPQKFWATDWPFNLRRFGFSEETFFDISYDPVRVNRKGSLSVLHRHRDHRSRRYRTTFATGAPHLGQSKVCGIIETNYTPRRWTSTLISNESITTAR
jgi:hypothetical protein